MLRDEPVIVGDDNYIDHMEFAAVVNGEANESSINSRNRKKNLGDSARFIAVVVRNRYTSGFHALAVAMVPCDVFMILATACVVVWGRLTERSCRRAFACCKAQR
jgi:hypothetical protein